MQSNVEFLRFTCSLLKSVTGIGVGNGLSGEGNTNDHRFINGETAFINWLSEHRQCIVFLYIKEVQIDWQKLKIKIVS